MGKSTTEIQLNSVWLKAAVVGGLWASVEIIIGSFFHNLRIPFAGSILATNGTILAIAFYQMWPEKGLIWRAGLITALMKSISPSAVILGPMLGIMTEALILELFIRLFGNNFISLAIAGALSVSSALIHKIISLLILYGLDIARLYADIFHFAAKQLRFRNADPWDLIIALICVYIILGIIAAFTGIRIGKKSRISILKERKRSGYKLNTVTNNDILVVNKKQKFSIPLFFVHLILIPAGLLIVNLTKLEWAAAFITIYSVACILRYKNSLRRLRKPVFWIQLFILTFLAAIFWNGFQSSGSFFDIAGLKVGLGMNLRAVFVVIAFSSLGIELRNPVIKDFQFNKGMSKIYLALGLSFSALPVMIEAMPKPSYFLRHPIDSFSEMMIQANEWLMVFEKSNK